MNKRRVLFALAAAVVMLGALGGVVVAPALGASTCPGCGGGGGSCPSGSYGGPLWVPGNDLSGLHWNWAGLTYYQDGTSSGSCSGTAYYHATDISADISLGEPSGDLSSSGTVANYGMWIGMGGGGTSPENMSGNPFFQAGVQVWAGAGVQGGGLNKNCNGGQIGYQVQAWVYGLNPSGSNGQPDPDPLGPIEYGCGSMPYEGETASVSLFDGFASGTWSYQITAPWGEFAGTYQPLQGVESLPFAADFIVESVNQVLPYNVTTSFTEMSASFYGSPAEQNYFEIVTPNTYQNSDHIWSEDSTCLLTSLASGFSVYMGQEYAGGSVPCLAQD